MMIYKYLDLSTAHIEQSDSEILHNHFKFNDRNIPFRVIEHDYGFWVNIQPDIANDFRKGLVTPLSDKFSNLYQYAEENDCNWIDFDCDAEIEDQFPVCEW